MNWQAAVFVFLGGGIGSVCRYVSSIFIQEKSNTSFPLSTFVINVVGCFLIGLFTSYFTKNNQATSTVLLFTTGFCGGFTTFSTFGLENTKLIDQHHLFLFITYSMSSILLGIIAVYAGLKIAK